MAGESMREYARASVEALRGAHTNILTLTYSRTERVQLGLGKNTNYCDVIPHFIVDGKPI